MAVRILIVGSGGVGGYFGARLAQNGADVTFVARGEHASAMRQHGLLVESKVHGVFRVAARVLEAPSGERFDFILIAVKNPATRAVASLWRESLAQGGAVLSLQNGVTAEGVLAEYFPKSQVLGGLCYVGARVKSPGVIEHTAAGRIVMGPLEPAQAPLADRVQKTLSRHGIPTELSPDIKTELWRKLLWNASLNPITALVRLPIGLLLKDPAGHALTEAAMRETLQVARAEGARLSEEDVVEALTQARDWDEVTTSMHQDLEAGRPLELEALVGDVVRLAERHQIAAPTLKTLYATLQVWQHRLSKEAKP